jgi:hypothetical protein
MNSQNVFHVVEVEIDCPREIPVVSAAYVMEDSTNRRVCERAKRTNYGES